MGKLVGLVALILAGALSGLRAAPPAPVRVAYVYSSWPAGKATGREQHPDFTGNADWSCDAFETRAVDDLVERLAAYDLVVLGWTFNLEDPVDLSVHGARLLEYLAR